MNSAAELTPEAAKSRRKLSWTRRWLLRGIAMLMGLSFVGLFEAALHLIGFGHDLRLIVPVPNSPGWYQLNSRFDESFFGQTNLSGPDIKPFRMPKPAGTRRILIVGGSTVIGFPYTPDLAFPRLVQEVLQIQNGEPPRIEVLNAGITALNSSAEVAVVEEGVACDPDVIVVYTGHNEFYGPGGVASGAGRLDPDWFRRLAYWKRLRLVQLARWLMPRPHAPPDLMDQLSSERRITRDSLLFQEAVKRFEQNLRAMQTIAMAKHIPLLLVGPACNERDQPPLEPALPQDPVPNEPAWHADVRKAEHWLRYEQPDNALPLLQSATHGTDHSAIIEYRLGQTYDRLQQNELAAQHYAAAVEADGTRFRASAAFRDAMQSIAQNANSDLVRYLDARTILINETEKPSPGEMHFLEHVHFTWAGNVAMAKGIARCIQQDLWHEPWSEERPIDATTLSERLAVQSEEHLAAETLAMVIYEKPPFSAAADAKFLAKRWSERIRDGVRRLPASRREVFMDISSAEMAQDLLLALEQHFRSKPLDSEHGAVLAALVHRRPWLCRLRDDLARWQAQHLSLGPSLGNGNHDWPCLQR